MKTISTKNSSETNDTEKKILKTVKTAKRPLSKTQIAHHIHSTPATVAKYVDILVAKNMLTIVKYGNIHLVSKGDENVG